MKIKKETDRGIALRYLLGISDRKRRVFLSKYFDYAPVSRGLMTFKAIMPTEERLKSLQARVQ